MQHKCSDIQKTYN